MVLFTKRLTCCVFLISFVFTLVQSLKLNKPRILLAYNYGLSSNFTLIVTDADRTDCFEWQSSNELQVIVSPISEYEGCSQKAVVSAVYSARDRTTVRVTATLSGNEDLHCDVILDTPTSIQLETLSDELHIGGPPEVVSIIAKDQYGHPFSSVGGLQFEWILRHETDESLKSGVEVARLKRFADSNYSSSVDGNAMEIRGLYGDSVLVEAVRPGICYISVTLKSRENEEQELSAHEVKLTTLPNFKVYPSNYITMLHSARIEVYVEEINLGKVSDYALETGGLVISSTEYGVSQISLTSTNLNFPNLAVKVKVVKPSTIVFRISGGGFRKLEALKMYVVSLELLDQDGNEIHPSDNVRLMVHFPTKQFFAHSSTPNGTYHVVQTVAPGKAVIKAEFKGVLLPDGSTLKESELFSSVEVTVLQKLLIHSPPFVFLPSEPSADPLHEMNMKVTGGSGSYLWSTSNASAARITFDSEESHRGKLEIFKESDFTVTVTDKENINLISTVEFLLQPVIDLEVYPTVVETTIGNTIVLPVAVLGYESKEAKIVRKFDDCSKIQPTVEIIEKHVIRYDPDPHIPGFGKGCLSLNLKCTSAGYSRINVSYRSFKTTTVVACFKPLKPVHPVRVAVIAIGASKEIAFEGGPRKFVLFKEGHYTRLEASNPELVDIDLIKDPIRYNRDLTVFRVRCKAFGENTLTFLIGNENSATNPHPAESRTTVKVICSEPSTLHVKLFKSSKRDKLPENVVKVPFYGNKEFSIDVYVKDAMGRKFSNISSLALSWEISDKELAAPESYSGFKTYENAVAGYRKVTRDFKEFKMMGGAGELKVSVKLEGYNPEVLAKEGVSVPAKKFEEISASIDLKLVSLRDINAGLYSNSNEDSQNEVNTCDGDTCKS